LARRSISIVASMAGSLSISIVELDVDRGRSRGVAGRGSPSLVCDRKTTSHFEYDP
jgi:hypothetical protein